MLDSSTETRRLIVDATLIVLDMHLRGRTQRVLHPLRSEDFERIQVARQKCQAAWARQRHNHRRGLAPKVDYHTLRKELLDRWQRKHGWSQRTRNLYASVLSVLVNWKRHGVPPRDRESLREIRRGAALFLQFLEGYDDTLI